MILNKSMILDLDNEDFNQSGNDYYGAIRNTAVQKYGRKFMEEIKEIKKLWTNKIYLVSFIGRQFAIKLTSSSHFSHELK